MISTTSTLDVARWMAAVADALAGYDHLPAVDGVTVWAGGDISLHSVCRRPKDELPWLCSWAAEFGTEITISVSYGGSGDAHTTIDLAGTRAKLSVSLHSGQAYELGAALRRPIGPERPEVTVTPAELLAAIDGDAHAARSR